MVGWLVGRRKGSREKEMGVLPEEEKEKIV